MSKSDWISPTVYVSLTTDGHPEDCSCSEHYSAIVMAWGEADKNFPKGTWYNAGIVCWAKSPEEAFKLAVNEYRNSI